MVSEVSWNPKYNMFALAGFGHNFPVMVYIYQRTEEQLNEILFSNATATALDAPLKSQTSGNLLDQSKGAISGGGTARGTAFSFKDKENEHYGNVNVRANF